VFRVSGATGEGVAELLAAAVRALDAVDAEAAAVSVASCAQAPRRARRIVVKIGSGFLTDDGRVRNAAFGQIARQVAQLVADGREVVLVSSGAIAVGSRTLGWSHPGHSIPRSRPLRRSGRSADRDLSPPLRAPRLEVAQILLTRAGLEQRERFLNARHTLHTLLRLGVVPIVNENDTVATEEIRFGDNDNSPRRS
jgi:glutamate 5-kinase